MSELDWYVLGGTLLFIVLYGSWKTYKNKSIESYLLGNKSLNWPAIGLSVMATQASAITFLSTPGQAYVDGMGFVQFYFGLPIAIVFICVYIVPHFYRLKVYTAYEYLENRFDLNTRLFAAFLFLISRGLAAGITIYAPAIILSSILGWDLTAMNLIVGVLVIFYTVTGGSRAVTLTQKWQMGIIMLGMFIAFGLLLSYLPVGFGDALKLAGTMGKMEVIDWSFDLNDRYTIWSGLTGGLFLALSYFGTDQSQVQRYLGGKSLREIRLGLLFNAWLKIPMQFFILLTGVLVFVFFQFEKSPAFYNEAARSEVLSGPHAAEYSALENQYYELHAQKRIRMKNHLLSPTPESKTSIVVLGKMQSELREQMKGVVAKTNADLETKDSDYIFVHFILNYLPVGIVGLLLAVILSAAMSSTAGELNALASTTTVDFYKRIFMTEASNEHYVLMSRIFTVFWGILAIAFAIFAHLVDNLIQAVNILGSLFYGTILGIFLVALFLKQVKARAVLIGGVAAELFVVGMFFFSDIGFLWYNVIGCFAVVLVASVVHLARPRT